MSSSVLHPPAHLPPSVALQLSQQAPALLQNAPTSISPYSFSSLISAPETADLWTTYENLMLSCLRTGDQESARLCLDRLSNRFGAENERILALQGLYKEAIAEDDKALQHVLEEYEAILKTDPSNIPVSKRKIALLKTLGKTPEAIASLTRLLDSSPTDPESWAELGDLYVSQGMYQQAIFSFEEVLLIAPNAWNIHARLGEILYLAAGASTGDADKYLAEALRRYCRSIELCDDFLRGYYGLKLTSNRLLQSPQAGRHSRSDEGPSPPDVKTLQRLNQTATSKLAEIVRRSVAGESGWQGYDAAELIAARELLDRDSTPVTH